MIPRLLRQITWDRTAALIAVLLIISSAYQAGIKLDYGRGIYELLFGMFLTWGIFK